ncbi:MAG TPA: alcohol dehydrogenase catalytic domain-containing protein [Roseiflexaceae bacterium]|nr:alcohol dehydrogenase catalytic domain-containing protein [Roseiflexaceae bacterium]
MLSYDIVEWGKPLGKRERDTPVPQGTEVLIQVKYCGVCHSDVHIRDGYFDLGGGKRLHMSERGMVPPVTLGHEPYGTVIAAGPEAGRRVARGVARTRRHSLTRFFDLIPC